MADARIEHVFECSEDTYWRKIFFDEEYNRRLFLEGLRFPVWKQTAFADEPKEIRRTLEVVPKLGDLPGPLKKLVGEGAGYREDGVYDKDRRRYRTRITTNRLSDKLKISGELFTEPAGERRCKRIFQCSVVADIFGVGGMLEKRVIADMQESYATAARFTNDFIREKGL
jgi:hypothetical protein